MSPLAETLLTNLVLMTLAMLVLWVAGVIRRDASIVDPFWGTGFVVVGWTSWLLNYPTGFRTVLVVGQATVWGVRLSLFLLWRNWGRGEDRRYVAMRNHHGRRFWWVSLFTVFWLQGVILWLVSFPLQFTAAYRSANPLGWLDACGVVVWGIGLFFEAVGDWQLAQFRANPANAGQVLDCGLWRYTRHPNYFGDFCVWWGMYLVAVAGGAGWTIASPLLCRSSL